MTAIDAGLEFFAAAQADQFTQEATVRRPAGAPVTNASTGAVTHPATTVATAKACKVTSNERAGTDTEAAETEVRIVDHLVKFAVGFDIREGDIVEITAARHNAADVGRSFRVTDVDRREWQIARRCVVEEVLVPMDWSED